MNTSTLSSAAIPAAEIPGQRLEHFPVAIFSTIMGTAGLTLVWLKAHAVLGMPALVGEALRGATSALFILLLLIYGLKALRHPEAIWQEMRHPIRINFFPTISISLLLLAIAYLESAPEIARILWIGGAILHLGLTLAIFNSWMHHTHYAIEHANPAWFIPVVGNIIVPVAGVRLASPEISWFFFSIGLVFWLVLMTIVLYRIFFHEPLPVRLTPTLFILLAPPSVGFIAYTGLTDQIDGFARILYYTALFLALLLASNAVRFLQTPFFISAWAYSFPLAALTLATLIMGTRLANPFFNGLGLGLLVLLTAVVAGLAGRTLLAIWRRQLCTTE
ncbi:MAG TPA: C4-dicarboxylate ABC transporter [Gammaproteobacteria bacterium]|nr:C4-dicarboxylate ABC transporter [Gammaproteobacteria bacterium]